MGKIIILDENTTNKIAAGEVVERPASVVKELVENSLDAGASKINIEIRNGGISYIKITDNGSGMEEDDAVIAFERHSTSKIRHADDIENVTSMGFRGEALASIAAVSSVKLTTRTYDKTHGTSIEIRGGSLIGIKPSGCPAGTTIEVRDLFFNTPARYKFLKKDSAEAVYISDAVSRIALGNPNVSIKLTGNGSVILHTPGNSDLKSTIFSIYGKDAARDIYEINYDDGRLKITGYVGKPELARSSRNHQSIFINKRYIRSKIITSALDDAFSTFLMKNKYAFSVLNLEIKPIMVDVNVHPSKMEVKFSNEQEIYKAVYHAVNNALLAGIQISDINPASSIKNTFNMNNPGIPELGCRQQSITYEKTIPADITVKVNETPEESEYANKNNAFKMETSTAKDEVKTEITREDSSDKHIDILNKAKIIGQVFNTYILLQYEDQLILVDQHAAHERILFEEFKEKIKNKMPLAQSMISGMVIELTGMEINFLEENMNSFIELGFDFESFGKDSIILRSVPISEVNNSREIFLELLDYLMNRNKTDKKFFNNETIYKIACKAAVKANKRLDELEINYLLNKLSNMENPYTCPHGRPSVIKITKYELEKMFKRIV